MILLYLNRAVILERRKKRKRRKPRCVLCPNLRNHTLSPPPYCWLEGGHQTQSALKWRGVRTRLLKERIKKLGGISKTLYGPFPNYSILCNCLSIDSVKIKVKV